MTTVDQSAFRAAAGSFGSGVTVVTTNQEGSVHGMTVSAFASLSLDPMQVLVSLRTGSRLQGMVQESRNFAVSILREGQREIASHFAATGLAPAEGAFPQFACETSVTGARICTGALAHFDCRVAEAFECGDHVIFVGDVVAAGSIEGEPLLYFKGSYRGVRDWSGD